jgi:hypothetical protein
MRQALAIAALALFATACAGRYVREPVYDDGGISVVLRSESRAGKTVARNFDHPATISGLRVAHVLARVDVRMGTDEGGERVPAFPTISLYKIGEELARAFTKATPDQEIVVKAVREEKRFGIFHARYLTSFSAWMRGGDLVIHLSRVEWEIPKTEEAEEIPEVYTDRVVQDFKVFAAEGIIPAGDQQIAADWRNPVFRKATNVRVGGDGKLMRRKVLLESETPEEGAAVEQKEAEVPHDLSPATLRALADLQERRAAGEISETTYHRERRDLLRAAEEERKKKARPAVAPAPAPPSEPDYGPLER